MIFGFWKTAIKRAILFKIAEGIPIRSNMWQINSRASGSDKSIECW
jgi:hypothetical protein